MYSQRGSWPSLWTNQAFLKIFSQTFLQAYRCLHMCFYGAKAPESLAIGSCRFKRSPIDWLSGGRNDAGNTTDWLGRHSAPVRSRVWEQIPSSVLDLREACSSFRGSSSSSSYHHRRWRFRSSFREGSQSVFKAAYLPTGYPCFTLSMGIGETLLLNKAGCRAKPLEAFREGAACFASSGTPPIKRRHPSLERIYIGKMSAVGAGAGR